MDRKNRDELAELLSAYVDGELSSAESARVDSWLREDDSAQRLLDELRQTVGLVSSLPRRTAPDSVVDDIRRRVERSELLGDAPPDPTPSTRGRWSIVRTTLSMAAVLAVVVVAGLYITHDRTIGPETSTAERFASAEREIEPGVAERAMDRTPAARRAATHTPTARPSRVADAARPERGADRTDRNAASKKDRPVESEATLADASTKPGATDGGATHEGDMEQRDADRLLMQATGDEPEPSVPDALVLAVSVGSEREGRELLRSLAARFDPTAIVDNAPARVQNNEGPPTASRFDETDSESSRRMRRAAKSRDDSIRQQLTLRVPLRSLPRLFKGIDSDPALADVTLQAGPVTVKGRDRVRAMAEVIASSASPPVSESPTSANPVQRSNLQSALRDILAVMGIDPTAVEPLASGVDPSKATDATSGANSGVSPVEPGSEALVGPAAPEPLVAGPTATGDEPSRPTPLLARVGRDEADGTRTTAKPQPNEDEGEATRTDEPSSLVSRRERALGREADDVVTGTVEAAPTESEETTAGVTNRPLVLATRPTDTDTHRASKHREPSTTKAQPEEMITIVVRVEVDPKLGRAGKSNAETSGSGSQPTKQPDAAPGPSDSKPSTKPPTPKPHGPLSKPNKSDSNSFKQ